MAAAAAARVSSGGGSLGGAAGSAPLTAQILEYAAGLHKPVKVRESTAADLDCSILFRRDVAAGRPAAVQFPSSGKVIPSAELNRGVMQSNALLACVLSAYCFR
jgi:hypothetical protein